MASPSLSNIFTDFDFCACKMWHTVFCVLFSQWTILVGVLLIALYIWGTSTYKYFDGRGIPYEKPLPFVGNSMWLFSKKENIAEFIVRLYTKYKKEKVYGMFQFRKPVFVIKDPELIKQITVKDFDHFIDHTKFFEDRESLLSRTLSVLDGQKWKEMRSVLSPAFTGSKIRQMLQLANECTEKAVAYLLEEAKKKDPFVPEMKDIYSRLTNDVIATCAFGIEVNSLKDKDNRFYKMGNATRSFSTIQYIKIILMFISPKLASWFGIKIFGNEVEDFFRHIVKETIDTRERNGIVRHDMIQLLMQIRDGSLKDNDIIEDSKDRLLKDGGSVNSPQENKKVVWEDDDLTAQCLLFFFAGFEIVSSVISLASHELCINPDIQAKLRAEIDEVRNSLEGGPITYEVLQKMKYMDMVVSETLRKWPVAVSLDRVCVKPYIIEEENGRKIQVNPGDTIMIPVYGVHQDPEIYPDPMKFNPDRFDEQNKDLIRTVDFMPFGLGPRNCIGSRFALMEVKSVLYYMLSNFTLEVSEKTQIPLKLRFEFGLTAEKGYNIRLKPSNIAAQ